MTVKAIAEQIEVIRTATANASVSKETALAFLIDAGIIERPDGTIATFGGNNHKINDISSIKSYGKADHKILAQKKAK